jgi:hypothetical protein
MTEPARLARWLTGDMRALAKLVDEAPATAFTDDEVSSAREHLMESLDAAGRAARTEQTSTDDPAAPARCEP